MKSEERIQEVGIAHEPLPTDSQSRRIRVDEAGWMIGIYIWFPHFDLYIGFAKHVMDLHSFVSASGEATLLLWKFSGTVLHCYDS